MKIEYLQEYRGAVVTANRDGAQYTNNLANQAAVYSAAAGDTATLTGYYVEYSSTNYRLQTTSGLWIMLLPDKAWNVQQGVYTLPDYSVSQAQACVNKIMRNNQIIIQHNILCARFANKLTDEQAKQLRGLQERLQARNAAIRDNSMCEDVYDSFPSGYVYLQQYLVEFMASNRGVGIAVSTIIYIAIAATVIAGLGTAAYFMYRDYADESERDVKYSEELTKTLTEKLTEDEYQQLLNETKGIVTKARIKSSLGSYGKVLLFGGIAAASIFVYRYISKKISK